MIKDEKLPQQSYDNGLNMMKIEFLARNTARKELILIFNHSKFASSTFRISIGRIKHFQLVIHLVQMINSFLMLPLKKTQQLGRKK